MNNREIAARLLLLDKHVLGIHDELQILIHDILKDEDA